MVAEPRILAVGEDPPPLRSCAMGPSGEGGGEFANGRPSVRHQGHHGKSKGTPARCKTAGRFAVVNAFLDFSAAELSRAEALTWLVLWRDTKPDGTAQTSQVDIARRIGANVSTVKRAVAALVKARLLIVVCRGSLRRGPSAYRVRPLPRGQPMPATSPPGR
jgi:hypothetical protein